jgi:hypothetical protein
MIRNKMGEAWRRDYNNMVKDAIMVRKQRRIMAENI